MQAQVLEIASYPAALTQGQRAALISLLVDADPSIYRMVRSRLLAFGQSASDWLRPYTLSGDPVMRRRAIEITNHLARQVGDSRFLSFCRHNGEDLDLEEAVGLLAQTQYPEANVEAYGALYDVWASELRGRIAGANQPEQLLGIINHYLFEQLRFEGGEQYGYDPECCYLNRVVDRRKGNPMGLCAIYLFVARRLRLPIVGIGLPGHFICRYQSSTKEIYIDCYRKGIFLSKADCIKYLLQANHSLAEGHLVPVTGRRMLLRMCHNLHQTYGQLELGEHVSRVQRYVAALSR